MHALDEEYVTVAEAASLLHVAPSTVRRWIREGTVAAYRVGKRRVALKRADLDLLIRPIRSAPVDESRVQEVERRDFPPLTPEEKQQAMEAMDRARRRAAEIRARRGGKLFPNSWETLAELRDERTRQLS
jgi:excisionase family DNA binding protein